MKGRGRVFVVLAIMVAMVSCASQPVLLGDHNPAGLPEDDLVTLNVFNFVSVYRVNDDMVDWPKNSMKQQVVKIPAGVNTFLVTANDGRFYTLFPMQVAGLFEKGNTYYLKCKANREKNGYRASFHIFLYNDNKEGKEVTLDLAKLRGNDSSVISKYIKYVLNPRMDEVGNSVMLENGRYILMYKPDLIYTMTDKETGTITEGRAGFNMDLLMTNGKAFLLETDISAMSSKDFLASKYTENAQIVLIPVKCSETEVTYRYEKPIEVRGTEITFSITEIQKDVVAAAP